MITTVIFDMDGLLFDTEKLYFRCYQQAAREKGLDFPFELFTACIGISREDANHFMRQHFGTKINPEQLNQRAFTLVEEYLMSGQDISVKPGAKKAVELFYRRNLKLGLASSNMRRWIDFYLKKTGLGFYFNTVTSCEEVTKLKPDPEIYLKTAAKLQSDVSQCLVFEDSVPGVTAGICAGMRTCMVPDLKQPNTFVRENAFKIYTSLQDISNDLKELLS